MGWKSPGSQLNFMLDSPPKFEVKPTKIHGEIFAIFGIGGEGPSKH